MMLNKSLKIINKYDIRPIDFFTGKRLPISTEEMKDCDCCGRKLVKINEMANGDIIGDECINKINYILNHNLHKRELSEKDIHFHNITRKEINYAKKIN